jgi:hypothetical protein
MRLLLLLLFAAACGSPAAAPPPRQAATPAAPPPADDSDCARACQRWGECDHGFDVPACVTFCRNESSSAEFSPAAFAQCESVLSCPEIGQLALRNASLAGSCSDTLTVKALESNCGRACRRVEECEPGQVSEHDDCVARCLDTSTTAYNVGDCFERLTCTEIRVSEGMFRGVRRSCFALLSPPLHLSPSPSP